VEERKEEAVTLDQEWIHRLKIFETVPIARMVSKSALGSILSSSSFEKNVSLWTAPIFEVASSKEESIDLAMERLDRIRDSLGHSDTMELKNSSLSPRSKDSRVIGWTSFKESAQLARGL